MQKNLWQFLADRLLAYSNIVCLSVCLSVTLCIVAKRYILQQRCLNSEQVNRKCPFLRIWSYNFQLPTPTLPLKHSTTIDVAAIWWINLKHNYNGSVTYFHDFNSSPLLLHLMYDFRMIKHAVPHRSVTRSSPRPGLEAMSRPPSEQVAWPTPHGQLWAYTSCWPLEVSRHVWTLGGDTRVLADCVLMMTVGHFIFP